MLSISTGSFQVVSRISPAIKPLLQTQKLKCTNPFIRMTIPLQGRYNFSSIKNSSRSNLTGTSSMNFAAILKSNERPISEAVEEFLNAVNPALVKGDEASLEEAWHELTTLAQQTSHTQQDRLTEFVIAIHKQSGPLTDDGKKVEVWGQETSWESLPLLGPELRKCWNTGKIRAESLNIKMLTISQHLRIQKNSTKVG